MDGQLRALLWAGMVSVALCVCVSAAEPMVVPAADPAAGLPAGMLVYGELAHETCRQALGLVAMPPAAGLVPGPQGQRFSMLAEMLQLPPDAAERAALNLDCAAFGVGPAGPMLVVSFNKDYSPAELLAGAGAEPGSPAMIGPEAAVGARGSLLCIATPPLCAQFMAGGYPAMADQPDFAAARQEAAQADAWLYVNVRGLVQFARMAAHGSKAHDLDVLLEALGVANAERLTVRLDIKKAALEGSLRLGEADKGLLSLLPGGPLDLVSVVPKSPSAALLFEWQDAPAFFGGVRNLVTRIDAAEQDQRAEQEIAGFEQAAGLKLDDVFKQLGSGLAVYLPVPGEDGMLHAQQAVAVLALKDSDGFRATSARLLAMVTGGKPMLPQTFGDVPGVKLTTAPLVVAYMPDRAVIGMDRAAVEGYLKWAASHGPAMADKAPDAGTMLYLDTGLLLKSYPAPTPGTQLLLTLKRDGRDLRFAATEAGPPPSVARAYVGMVAVMGAMLMPALARARFEAQRAESAGNMHTIGLGLAMYKQGQGAYPPDLEALFKAQLLDDPSCLMDPADSSPVKVGGQMYPCSYEYAGALPGGLPSQFIIAYSRKGIRPDGRVVLFADNAVQSISEGDLTTPGGGRGLSLAECYQWLMDNHGSELTEDQKASFRRFYEVEPGAPAAANPPAARPADLAAGLSRAATARTEASKSASKNHLHLIGLGIVMYRNAHEDRFPPSLAPLVPAGFVTDASVFVDATDMHPVIHPGEDFPSSYEYAGPVSENALSSLIIAYSRKDLYPGGRIVLYADNSVRWVSEEDLHRPGGARGMSLAECYKWVTDNDKGELTDAQKAQVRRFYEVADK